MNSTNWAVLAIVLALLAVGLVLKRPTSPPRLPRVVSAISVQRQGGLGSRTTSGSKIVLGADGGLEYFGNAPNGRNGYQTASFNPGRFQSLVAMLKANKFSEFSAPIALDAEFWTITVRGGREEVERSFMPVAPESSGMIAIVQAVDAIAAGATGWR